MNTILNKDNKELYISLTNPYKNIKKILSYEDILVSSAMYYDIDKYFRFSYNNQSYSNWIELTNENLRYIKINMGEDFWIEYHYIISEIEDNESIEFKGIMLEVINNYEKVQKQICSFTTTNECCASTSVIEECCPNNLFNPYDLGNATNLYKDLSTMVSNMFGYEVDYYKTNPVLNSRDVILGECSVHNVEKKSCLKVLIPDNTIPSKEIQFNAQFGPALPDLFEVHIVRSEFENVFGSGERPRTEDYMYFAYLKKIYDVNAVMIADENALNTSTYYKVNLKEHSEKANRLDSTGLGNELKSMYQSFEEVMGPAITDEQNRIRKPQQYNSMDTNKDKTDLIRRTLNKDMVIRQHNLLNDKTYQVISDNYYDFTTIIPNQEVVTYKYIDGLPEKFAITFMLNAKEIPKADILNITIRDIYQSSSHELYSTYTIIETLLPHNLSTGNFINIKNSTHYNGVNYVLDVIDTNRFIIAVTFKGFAGGVINKVYDKQLIITNQGEFGVCYIDGCIVVKIKDKIYPFDFGIYTNKWLSIVINYSNKFNQLALYVYDSFIKKFEKTYILESDVYFDKKDISIVSGKYWFTNFRLFRECIEIEQQESVLSQIVVLDSHLALIIDNAVPRFRLQKHNAK